MADKLLEIIKKHDSIVVFGHYNPDGDCYGSQIALKRAITENYPTKKVYIVGTPQPLLTPIFGEMDIVSDDVIKNSLGIIVDCSNEARCEDQRVRLTKERIKFDHHIEGINPFDGVMLLDENKIATCEIIAEWLIKNNLRFDVLAAEALFLGIVMDSGRFHYDPTNASTFRLAATLIDMGVDMHKIYDTIYQYEEADLAFQGYILSRYHTTPEGFIYAILPYEDLQKIGVNENDASNKVNALGNIIGYPIWATFTGYPNGKYRAELRSKDIMIQPLAVSFGGGGHPHACGITFLEEKDIPKVVKAVQELLKEHKDER